MKRNEDLVILDYNTSTIHFYKVDVDTDTDITEEYIEKLGFNTDEVSWMVSEFIDVFKHKGVLCS